MTARSAPLLILVAPAALLARDDQDKQGVLKGGDFGPAVVPGDPDKSLLIKAIRKTSAELEMPPREKLSPEQVSDFVSWVKMGAPDPREDAAAARKPKIDCRG